MTKTAALNKLAQVVTEYIKAEQNYKKVANAIHVYQTNKLQKTAGPLDALKGLFGKAPAPKPSMLNQAIDPKILALLGGLGTAGAAYGISSGGADDIIRGAADKLNPERFDLPGLGNRSGRHIADLIKSLGNIPGDVANRGSAAIGSGTDAMMGKIPDVMKFLQAVSDTGI